MSFLVVSGMFRSRRGVAAWWLVAAAFVACSKDEAPTPPTAECPPAEPLTITLPAGFPELPNTPDNPLTKEGVALGRRLFYDPILSGDSTLACGGCHTQSLSFGDFRPFSEGIHGHKSRRQAPTIVNPAWNQHGVFWDGRAADLEEQATNPVPEVTEMDLPWPTAVERLEQHAEYPDLFCAAFGTSEITQDRVVKAIAQFERTFISVNSKYDRWRRGDPGVFFTTMELRGFRLFMREGRGDCFHCHDQSLFATGTFHNTGLDSVVIDGGRGEITGNPADLGKFKSPSLRNVAESPPYMHDGRFFSIREVLDHYNGGFRHGLPDGAPQDPSVDPLINKRIPDPVLKPGSRWMTSAELDTLEVFLNTLTDWEFLGNPDLSDPFAASSPVANSKPHKR